jgi:propionyl-CoA carboxylase alpha chain
VGYRLGRSEQLEVDGAALGDVSVLSATYDRVELLVGGVRRRFEVHVVGDTVHVDTSRGSAVLEALPRFPGHDGGRVAGSLVAPMPGTIVRVEVTVHQTVAAGQLLAVIEAMKMEHMITAPGDGVVTDVRVDVGQVVDAGEVLVVLAQEGTER